MIANLVALFGNAARQIRISGNVASTKKKSAAYSREFENLQNLRGILSRPVVKGQSDGRRLWLPSCQNRHQNLGFRGGDQVPYQHAESGQRCEQYGDTQQNAAPSVSPPGEWFILSLRELSRRGAA
jgi:hypothetical protein